MFCYYYDRDNKLIEKEKVQGISIFDSLDDLGENGMYYRITISRTRNNDSKLDEKKIKEIAMNNWQNEDLEELKIETENSIYDLLKKNLHIFYTSIDTGLNISIYDQMYNQFISLYHQKISSILKKSR